ncbi:MAG TPA: hypothetical protein VL443_03365 [Cyclobacteriaceae bacterium]|jgi:hypothetical protein|nr:hypothetical protein [Cyclobacteriaceae bacterium]
MMNCKLLVPFFLIAFNLHFATAQIYTDKEVGKTRYSFAQTTIGYNMDFNPVTGHSYLMKNGNLEKFTLGTGMSPVISITGLHFWGHAEFFTGFSLPSISIHKTSDYSFSRSAGTGFKIFPIQIREKRIAPYFGISLSSFSYKLQDAVTYKRIETPLLAGVTYSFKHGLLELGMNYYHRHSYQYYVSKSQTAELSLSQVAFSVDYKYFFDLSNHSYKNDISGATKTRYEKLKQSKRLSSFSIAAGPAYSFFTRRSSYNNDVRPYLDQYKISRIFPDLGIGYYNYKLDASVNLAYRFYSVNQSAFDVSQTVKRKSIALEAYKFFFDYHGFVPFAGPILSRENIQVNESEASSNVLRKTYDFWTPGIIVGWDIRPTRVDWWGVRTNIRYFPWLQLPVSNNHNINLQQIELNFLQMIIYPNRLF